MSEEEEWELALVAAEWEEKDIEPMHLPKSTGTITVELVEINKTK